MSSGEEIRDFSYRMVACFFERSREKQWTWQSIAMNQKNADLGQTRQGTNLSPLFQCLDEVANAAVGQNC